MSLPEMACHLLVPLVREIQRDLPIIVTTDRHSPELEREVRRSDVTYYAIRPDDLSRMSGVVKVNLSRGAPAAAASAANI